MAPTRRINVKFAEGAPVVWWPAVAKPVDDSPGGNLLKMPRPYRSLVWTAWIGDQVPVVNKPGLVKMEDFALPDDCWVRQARLPGASRLTVVGNIEGTPKVRFPGGKDRLETEGFLYYDGLVPAPDFLMAAAIPCCLPLAAEVTICPITKRGCHEYANDWARCRSPW